MPIADAQIDKYAAAAERLAAAAVQDLSSLVPCSSAGSLDESCARQFAQSFGARAYRRPLEADEAERYVSLFKAKAAGGSAADGVRLMVAAFLQSVHFLYHLEQPTKPPGVVRLTDHEAAARVAYFITGAPPDAELTSSASQGTLAFDLDSQVRRLLALPSARGSIERLHQYLVGVDRMEQLQKDPAVAPEFTPELASAMKAEVGRFASHVMFDGDHTLRSLLTGSFSVVEPPLAPIYGLPAPSQGFVALENRFGLLTLPGVMATHSDHNQTSPIKRGKFLRVNIMCQDMPPPPPNVQTDPPAPDPSLPTRERFAAHRKDPTCSACHQLLDPLGFGLEAYDTIGRFRTTDGNFPVDDKGELNGAPASISGPFDGISELADKLVTSPEVRDCMAKQWMSFALGRAVTERDSCVMQQIGQQFADSGGDLHALVSGIVKSPAFYHRGVE